MLFYNLPSFPILYEVSSVEYAKKNRYTKNLIKTAINLGKWKKSIVNHFYRSEITTPNNDGIMIAALIHIERALIRVNYSGETMS